MRITKALIRLRECAGWSAPVLFANPTKTGFLRVEAQIIYNVDYIENRQVFNKVILFFYHYQQFNRYSNISLNHTRNVIMARFCTNLDYMTCRKEQWVIFSMGPDMQNIEGKNNSFWEPTVSFFVSEIM